MISIGGYCGVVEIPITDLGLIRDDKPDRWVKKIGEIKEDSVVVYMDGSMSEGGGVGRGWCSEGGAIREDWPREIVHRMGLGGCRDQKSTGKGTSKLEGANPDGLNGSDRGT